MSIRRTAGSLYQGLARGFARSVADIAAHPAVARFAEPAAGLGLLAAVIVAGVVARPLLPVVETRYFSIAWEMWWTGDWFVPHFNGALYSQKPVLLFWLIDATWAIAGVGETAARLVPPAFALASVWLTWWIGRILWPSSPSAASRSALVIATSGYFMVVGSMIMFDAMLTAFALAALAGVVKASETGVLRWWVLIGVATGLGGLTKGPVILLHVLPAVLFAPLWAGRRSRSAWMQWYGRCGLALIIALAVVGLWLVPAFISAEPGWWRDLLWRQAADRIASGLGHARPFWFFLPLIPALLWPWGWWPPLWPAVRRELRLSDPAIRFCLLWVASALLIFSAISEKQPHYLVPELPALALLAGRAIGEIKTSRLRDLILPGIPVIAVGLAVTALALGLADWTMINPYITEAMPAVPALLGVGLFFGILWAVRKTTWAVALIAPVLALLVFINGQAPLAALWDGQKIADGLAKHQDGGLAIYRRYRGEFTFLGRLKTPLAEIESAEALKHWIATHPGGAFAGRTRHFKPDWDPILTYPWRGRPYGVWVVPRAGENGHQE